MFGHLIPGSFLMLGGLSYLSLTFVRCRNILKRDKQTNNKQKRDISNSLTFCKFHIPENNPKVLFFFGIFATVGPFLCILNDVFNTIENKLAHYSMLSVPLLIAVVCLLEAKYILPSDSTRKACAFAFLLNYELMKQHAAMKISTADIIAHEVLTNIHMAGFLTTLYAIANKTSLTAYILVGYLALLDGMWLITLALQRDPFSVQISAHFMSPVFAVEAFLLVVLFLVIIAIFFPGWDKKHVNDKEDCEYDADLQEVEEDFEDHVELIQSNEFS